jgi:hypothetical protein
MFPWKSLSVPEAVRARSSCLCIGSDSAALLLPWQRSYIDPSAENTHDCEITLFSWCLFLSHWVMLCVCIVKFYFPAKVALVFTALVPIWGRPQSAFAFAACVTKADWKIRSGFPCLWTEIWKFRGNRTYAVIHVLCSLIWCVGFFDTHKSVQFNVRCGWKNKTLNSMPHCIMCCCMFYRNVS